MEEEIQLSKLIVDEGKDFGSAEVNISFPHYEFIFEDEDVEGVKKLHQIMENLEIKEKLGEAIIWEHYFEEGIFFKKTKEFWIITNYRIMYGNYKTDVFLQVPLKYVDVVVMNSHSSFQSTGTGYGVAMPGSLAFGVGVMNRQGTSQRIGDLTFILEGQVILEFTNVADPTGVKNLINQVKKQMNSKSTKKLASIKSV